jgi:peptide/nickel transport system substrate-binding protein
MPEPEMGLDPLTVTTANSLNGAQLLHDPLIERDKNWKPIPWIAASWKTNADSSEWTFTLRDGIKFSDGSPITADDVKFSFDRMMASAVWKGCSVLSRASIFRIPRPSSSR